ncbi:MAG: AAA family ATPase, partial [Flavobacteriaceae bacterium]
MLAKLSIKNYALIDDISVSFFDGFTTLTGETGAGKSILLGGLSLVLGKRADLSSLRDPDKKCIIEAEFEIDKYNLEPFFKSNELVYDPLTVIRREIYPGGKSRAFINDSPVVLDILSQLGKNLIDIHSQHQTLQLTEQDFQIHVLDALGGNKELLVQYQSCLNTYLTLEKVVGSLKEERQNALKEQDYNSFLHKELEEAGLEIGMAEKLEAEYEELTHVETIIEHLSAGNQLLNDEQRGLIVSLIQLKQLTSRLAEFGEDYQSIYKRVESVLIEIDDLRADFQELLERKEPNPQLLEEITDKLQLLHDLQKKHAVLDADELINIKESLAQRIEQTENLDADIEA